MPMRKKKSENGKQRMGLASGRLAPLSRKAGLFFFVFILGFYLGFLVGSFLLALSSFRH